MTVRALSFLLAGAVALAALPIASAAQAPSELLARAIQLRTISSQDPAEFDPEAFRQFHRFVEEAFPRVHASLERHLINDWSLLYVWPGREPDQKPILLTAHFDVVPEGDASAWTHPPFAGVIAEGYVWGRGALDDKAGVIAMLAAAERLLAAGFQPRRTVFLAFGHDEEIGGDAGAGATADWLRERDVQLLFSLDEGMAITEGGVAGIPVPVALIGIAEKGYMTVRLVAHADGGHSSTPPPNTAIGVLAQAITRVEANPMPARIEGVVGGMLDATAPYLPTLQRIAIEQRWLLAPLVRTALEAAPATNAMIRTTTAVTMVAGGVKENVLPATAEATVNFRLAPGDTSDDVLAHVRGLVADLNVVVEPDSRATEPSPVADTGSAAYRLLETSLEELVPGIVVAPGLVLGGTDSKHYAPVADDAFRFTAFRLGPDDISRIHGVDERIAVQNFDEEVVPFYDVLLRGAEALPADGSP